MGITVVQSLSRAAEELVRAGSRGSLAWGGYKLTTHFQPIFGVKRGGCVGYEAFLRASASDGAPFDTERLLTRVSPDQDLFLDWVCRALHLRNFSTVDAGDRILFLNVKPRAAVADAHGVRAFADLVRYYGVAPERLCVQILAEDCRDEGLLHEAVCAYREFGAMVAVDDYGEARSNLDRVVALEPDIVKVDRARLAFAMGDARARDFIPALVALLQQAGCKVAIDGIEAAPQALAAIEAGADFLQGNYFASPAVALSDESFSSRMFAELVRVRSPARGSVPLRNG
jgi:EAL domain-containing protein (putative c-di-GMP-specific phosphodiesterase class I)